VLVEAFPEGAACRALDSITPYDLCLHWKHPHSICWLLLKDNYSLDLPRYISLKYGSLVGFFVAPFLATTGAREHVTIRPLGTYDLDDDEGGTKVGAVIETLDHHEEDAIESESE
jgi:hypothetical protein